ncbi:MAG: hypothetical protein IKB70_06245 [Bacilli bacterium]|nr:hypothetical protein [Bacilli bacterium]
MNIENLISNYIIPGTGVIALVSIGIFGEMEQQERKNRNDYIITIDESRFYSKKENIEIIDGVLYIKENNKVVRCASKFDIEKIDKNK